MVPFEFQPRTHVVFGTGAAARAGQLAADLGFRRTLLVADQGIVAAGHAATLIATLEAAGITPVLFDGFGPNPDSAMVEVGRAFAAPHDVDSIVALGGGSSLDCAKGIAFLLANGGAMADYRGYGKAAHPLPPMIGIPTTAGTGSEAQSYAVIADAATRMKMACGAPSAAFRVAILDPTLTLSAPRAVTAVAGYDAIAHAVETAVTTKRTPLSETFAHKSWALLAGAYERALAQPDDFEARSAMQVGAHLAGMAIEASMLGAAHACANPLTARYGLAHGETLAILLPQVVRWNAPAAADRYRTLLELSGDAPGPDPAETLARKLAALALGAGLPSRLAASGVDGDTLSSLAFQASQQWTGGFNPRPFDAEGALEIYRAAY